MKPRFVIVTLLVLALAVPASMLAQQNSKAEKEVRAVLGEMRTAAMKGGAEAIRINEKYNADDYVRIPGDGRIFTKAEYLNGFKAGNVTVESLDYSDVKIRIDGKMAVLTAIETGKGVQMGTPWTGTFRFTRVFVKRDGIWKVVLYQDTPLKQ
jgi:ketosteroid isomerase-like protein